MSKRTTKISKSLFSVLIPAIIFDN